VSLALICAGYLAAFGLVSYVSVRTLTGRELADASLRGAISARPLLQGTVQSILDVVSIASLLGAVAVVAVIALVRLARLEGLVAIGILVGSNATTWLLKNVVLSRPDVDLDEIAPATLNSLPGGHATAAFSAVAALVFVAPRRLRPVVAAAGAGYATLTGLASMLAGWHRAEDSVAAFLVVGAWTCVGAAVVIMVAVPAPGEDFPDGTEPLTVRWLPRLTVGSLVLGTALSLALVVASLSPDNALASATAFVAGSLFVAGAAGGVTIAVLKTLDLMESAVGTAPAEVPVEGDGPAPEGA
jgi:membrane-associated phospholipid phosphatase